MQKLVDKLNEWTKAYDEGRPLVSDKEWDDKYFELLKLEKELGYVLPNSPTQRIVYQVVNQLDKIEHNHKMLSLAKTKLIEEVRDFVKNMPFIMMLKMDGLTCSLTYEGGRLVSAETRGDGIVGENILHNALVIPSIPKKIKYKKRLVVDGEIVCTFEDFKNFANEYKNPRNFAAGSIRLLDSAECAKRKLRFVAWDVIEGLKHVENCDLNYLLGSLDNLGFTTVPRIVHINLGHGVPKLEEDDIAFLKEKAAKLGYPIDGIVFKFNDIEYGKSLGATAHHFNNAIAYKFYDETYETRLVDILWSMGRTGQISPIALFEKINIDGTEVSRASLSNISIMHQTLGPHPFKGQIVEVSKRNQIIPKIERAKDENGEWITNI